jgi:hypothetical protein
LSIERVRFIGGFGDIFWINPAEFLPESNNQSRAGAKERQ